MRHVLFSAILCVACHSPDEVKDVKFDQDKMEGFENLKMLFKNAPKPIPDSLAIRYLDVDTFQVLLDSFSTVSYERFSNGVRGLIYKGDCVAGGQCERTVVATFNTLGKKVDELEIAHLYSDLGFESLLSYEIAANEIVLKYKETSFADTDLDSLDTADKVIDSTSTYYVDTLSGLIRREERVQ